MNTFDDIQNEADARRPNGGGGAHDWAVRVAELALMAPIEFDRVAKTEAKALRCKVSTLEAEVARARPRPNGTANGEDVGNNGRGRELKIEPIELHPDPVDGAKLAEEISTVIARFVALSVHAKLAATLWTLHTHAFAASTITPRLNIGSPVRRCGKELLSSVAARPMMCSSISAAAVFRVVEAVRPTH
jgi:putative DNA primase/helicase